MLEMTSKLPQLAKGGDPLPDGIMEPKLDGHRILAFVRPDGVRLYARTGVDKTARMPAIVRELAARFPIGTILDGEVIAPDGRGGNWSGVQNILGSTSKSSDALKFVAFDILSFAGEDVRGNTYSARRSMLEMIFSTLDMEETLNHVTLIDAEPYDADAVAALIAEGWEGVIVKDPNARYASGKRGYGWVKIKATETEDVVVIGATEGKGQFSGLIGALVFGQIRLTNDGEGNATAAWIEKGQCSGMTIKQREEFSRLHAADALVGTVIEVQHMGIMESGGWRHPQFKRVRTDKPAAACVEAE